MKKFGFTLAEVIVTLGIIGLLAAITAPLLGSLTPDQNKIKVLKAYKILSDVTIEILNDPSLYLKNSNCVGLDCTDKPNYRFQDDTYGYSRYEGDKKYLSILQKKLETLPGFYFPGGSSNYIKTIDSIKWFSTPNKIDGKLNSYNITIDLDESESSVDKTYDEFPEGSKPKPDRFSFEVDLRGNVKGADSLTKAYLLNPNKLNDKKTDYARAKDLYDASKAKP